MSISFTCERCGKAFDVADEFAGKQGRCRQCGAIMRIPARSGARRPETISHDAAATEISPSRRPPTAATATSPPRLPADDVYGFEDSPSSSPARSGASVVDDDPPTTRVRGRKKRMTGPFSAGPGRAPSPGGPAAGVLKRVGLGIAAGMLGLLVKAVVIPAIQQGSDPNWASRRAIESYVQGQIDQMTAVAATLRGVRDVSSAADASAPANAGLKKWADLIRSNKDRKGRLTDIGEVKEKYQDDLARAEADLSGAIRGVILIPGAWDALAIQGAIDELASLAPGPGPGGMAGFVAPRLRPPPTINPALSPPGANPPFPPRIGPRPGTSPGSRNRLRGPGAPAVPPI